MIKFEEHEGQLFRMLEEPVPLTPDAEMPCLVRLIQDDSPMGRSNAFHLSPLLANNHPIIIDAVKDYSVSVVFNNMIFYYANFEIIGYPVDDGSKDWALYQMMQGHEVCNSDIHGGAERFAVRDGRIVHHVRNAFEDYCAVDIQLGLSTGWQLYKEPEYKVGDYIKDGDDYYVVTSPTTCVGLLNGKGYEICPKTCKIVFPSEEVLDFGSGIKGTVRICQRDGGCVRVISGDRVIAHIMTDVLEQPTRNLVMQLLKAQEEQ